MSNLQKGFSQIIILVLLLVGIVTGVWLVQHRTNLLPKAQEANYIQIVDKDGNSITQTDDPNVYLKITLPPGWQLPPEKPTSGLVKEVFAQECPQSGDGTTTTFGQTTYDKCVDNNVPSGNNDPTNNTLCSNGATKYRCFWSGDKTGCISGKDINDFNFDCPVSSSNSTTSTSNTTNSGTVCEPSAIDYVSCRKCAADGSSWGAEGSDFGPNSGSEEWCNCAKKYSPDYYKKTVYAVCQRKEVPILDKLVFGEVYGSNFTEITSNFGEYLNKPISFVLSSLPYYVKESKVKISLLFVSYYKEGPLKGKVVQAEVSSAVDILFKNPNYQPPAPVQSPTAIPVVDNNDNLASPLPKPVHIEGPIREYSLVVHIHAGLVGYEEKVENWVRDTVQNYINNEFQKAGINKKLKVAAIYPDYKGRICPTDKEGECESNRFGSIIHVWIYPLGYNDNMSNGSGYAIAEKASIAINLPSWSDNPIFGIKDKQLLAHEIMHMFGVPDYYLEIVQPADNPINHKWIFPFVADLMDGFNGDYDPLYSPTTAEFANKITTIPLLNNIESTAREFIPWETILEITGDKRAPLNNVHIEVFPQVPQLTVNGKYNLVLSDLAVLDGFTNDQGRFDLGNGNNFLNPYKNNKYNRFWSYSVLVRLTKGNEVRYLPITRSELYTLFLAGKIQEAVISVPFSFLDQAGSGQVTSNLLHLNAVQSSTQLDPILEEEKSQYLNNLLNSP